jgi:hypothetical protein
MTSEHFKDGHMVILATNMLMTVKLQLLDDCDNYIDTDMCYRYPGNKYVPDCSDSIVFHFVHKENKPIK